MTIVASNSLTISNVNDGTITHTAYAYSADGTDRFTTVYPNLNLNLLKNTRNLLSTSTTTAWSTLFNSSQIYDSGIKSLSGVSAMNFSFSVYVPLNAIVGSYIPIQLKGQTSQATNVGADAYNTITSNTNYAIKQSDLGTTIRVNIPIQKSLNYQSFDSALANTASITIRQSSNISGFVYSNIKLEKGSTATPYMPSASEVTTADWPSYIGQYTDFTQANSTNPSAYTWSLIRGNDGKDGANGKDGIAGKDGVGIKTTVITYAISTSGTIAPTTGWTSSVPSLIKGQYLWTKTVWTYTDNSSEIGYSVTYISKDGNNGNDGIAGKDGVGILTTTITYAGSTSGTTAPTSGWTSTIPTVTAGSYLWTKTIWAYTDNTSETGYSVAKMGNDGSITHTAYAYSADGTDRFTTVYPNLNLLKNTKSQSYTSTGTANNNSSNNYPLDGIIADILNKPLTITYSYAITNSSGTWSGMIRPTYGLGGTNQSVSNTNLSGTHKETVNLTNVGQSSYGILTSGLPAGTKVTITNLKVEFGSTATPYMPSASEVKTSDYPNYIGTYLDRNVESSSDYKRYQWTIFKGQDSNAYTAYSWSADGVDRFTNLYPNLNLLKGTKTPISITGNNSKNQTVLLYPFDNGKTLSNQGFNINDVLTLEFDWHATNPASGQFIFQWQGMPWGLGLGMPAINISPTNSSGHVVYTFNVRDGDIASTAVAGAIGYLLDYVPNNTVITLENVIIRKAKGSQPWMPSESEAQDQWQDAIPMYVGVGEKDSQNPSDYRWQLNPRYVQASSDSGLSNKAGVDDLASVANTANDALVQAQNAVSNEDYTSWLEHDYQTTIDNLQDVSVQNQEDIKNVDDRTTIVEGFYGEMKVKWNFIDESFSFSEEGMFISNAQSKMSIQITSDKIVFWDNNVDVAFITGEVLNIQKGVFLESATIGNHLITKFSDSSPVTIIRYVGGIT